MLTVSLRHIIGYVYSTDLVIVQNYMDAVDTVISQQQYDLRALVDFSTQTVIKQQEEFKTMRANCFRNIEALQTESRNVSSVTNKL